MRLQLDEFTSLQRFKSLKTLKPALTGLIKKISSSRVKGGFLTINLEEGDQKREKALLLSSLEQIAASRTIERARHYIKQLIKSFTAVRNPGASDLNLNRWKEYKDILTDSLWLIPKRDRGSVHSAGYWGNFIPQIPNQMLRRYTRKNEWVLDLFAGMGTTLIESRRLGRNCLGIELSPKVAARAAGLVKKAGNPHKVTTEIICGDSAGLDLAAALKKYGLKKVQHLIMHPPYFDIIKFSEAEGDLSNAADVDDFVKRMAEIAGRAAPFLEKKRYLSLVIGDKYEESQWVPLGFLLMSEILKKGFILKSIVVKNFDQTAGKRSQEDLWRYRALAGGFYIFKHEYIFIFQKR